MRPRLHKQALTRFAVGMAVAAGLPAGVALAGVSGTALALAATAGGVAALLGADALRSPRRRATGRRAA